MAYKVVTICVQDSTLKSLGEREGKEGEREGRVISKKRGGREKKGKREGKRKGMREGRRKVEKESEVRRVGRRENHRHILK